MLTCRCLPFYVAALLFGQLLGHASSVVPERRQPAHLPYPNVLDAQAQPPRDTHPLPQRARSPPPPVQPLPDNPRPPQRAVQTRQQQYRQQQQLQQQQQYHQQQEPQQQQQQQQQWRETLAPGNQRSGGRQESFRSDHGAIRPGDGTGRRVDPPAPRLGQSQDQPQPQPPQKTGGGDRPLIFHPSPPKDDAEKVPHNNNNNNNNNKPKELDTAYRLQVERRQQQQEASRRHQEAVHRQQEAIRKQLAEEEERQLLEKEQRRRRERSQQQQQPQQRAAPGPALAAAPRDDLRAHGRDEEVARRVEEDSHGFRPLSTPTNRPLPGGVGGGGVAFDDNRVNHNDNKVRHNVHNTNSNDDNDDLPDAPHGAGNVPNTNNKNGMSDEFRRGLIRKVYKGEEEEEQQQEQSHRYTNSPLQRHAFPPEQPLRRLGGMSINWDWDDFSMSFQNYGVAEMKVRRAPHATTGEPWPLPQYYTKKDKNILVVDPRFEFVFTNNITCDIVEQAIERYRRRIVDQAMEDMYDNLQNAEGTGVEVPEDKYQTHLYRSAPTLHRFSLKIRRPCPTFPSLDSDESYDLVVKKSSSYLWANEVWGLLRGLETLSQLIWRGPDDRLYVKESVISDYPRFPHRGILIDSSRHFIFKEVMFDMMDAMEMNKMNVLHWHIVDDQSFPYESKVFPELSAKGAYHPTFVYSLSDIAEIIDYGRMRGIRILPEFDSPGHTYSWGLSRPELLTQCYSGSSAVKGYLGPIDPVRNSTYRFLKNLFGEILHVFKDEYMHLGGDEVPLGCWQSNPDVVKFGKVLNKDDPNAQDNDQAYFGEASPSIRKVYEYYVNRVMKDIKDMGKARDGIKFIMWQEVMNNNLKLPNDTLIQVWMGDMADVNRAIGMGYDVLYSSCWYLDHVEYGVKWPKYYQCDPADLSYGYRIDEKKVKGGEACLWSEYIDNENLMQTTWPRSSAVAERLWSSKDTKNLDAAGERLSEHRCRMLKRGLSVGQISGPDYCLRSGVNRGRLREPPVKCEGAGCRGEAPPADPVETHSDIKFRVRTEGGGTADCNWWQVLLPTRRVQMGGHLTVLLLLLLIAFLLLLSLSRSSGKLYALRLCRHRTILLFFFAVLFVYFMCYTTMWMHVFEFSGSFQHKRHTS